MTFMKARHRIRFSITGATISILLGGCATPLPPDRQAKLDGVVLYGLVNLTPSEALNARAFSDETLKRQCRTRPEAWCSRPEDFTFATLLLMNTYRGGMRAVGTLVPATERIARHDILVVRLRADATAEFLRVASRGERPDCRWEGGGIGRALTAAGVICEDYDWRRFAPLFYD